MAKLTKRAEVLDQLHRLVEKEAAQAQTNSLYTGELPRPALPLLACLSAIDEAGPSSAQYAPRCWLQIRQYEIQN